MRGSETNWDLRIRFYWNIILTLLCLSSTQKQFYEIVHSRLEGIEWHTHSLTQSKSISANNLYKQIKIHPPLVLGKLFSVCFEQIVFQSNILPWTGPTAYADIKSRALNHSLMQNEHKSRCLRTNRIFTRSVKNNIYKKLTGLGANALSECSMVGRFIFIFWKYLYLTFKYRRYSLFIYKEDIL